MGEERNYCFYDKWSNVHYENLTKEEIHVLNVEYRKARYLESEQYRDRGVCFFSEFDSQEIPMDSYLIDHETCVEQQVTTDLVIEEMLSGLHERERQVIVLVAMAGYRIREAAEILGITERHELRLKKSAQKKIRRYFAELGVYNYRQASDFLLKKF